jgi:hypothetical protein
LFLGHLMVLVGFEHILFQFLVFALFMHINKKYLQNLASFFNIQIKYIIFFVFSGELKLNLICISFFLDWVMWICFKK